MKQVYLLLLNNYRVQILILLLLIFSFFVYNIKYFQLDASSDSLILEQDNDLKKYRTVVNDYGTNDFLIVTFSDKEKIITEENLSYIKSFINQVNSFSWVENTQSIFDAPLLEVKSQKLTDLINEVLTIETPGIDLAQAEKELLNSPIFKNLIISEDSTSTALVINFKKDEEYEILIKERDKLSGLEMLGENDLQLKSIIDKKYEAKKKKVDKERHENIVQIRTLINQFNFADLKVHLGGVSMIADDTISFVKNDIIVFGVGALIFILLVLFIVFRSPLWMFICISNCVASLSLMIGVISFIQWKVTVISSNFIMLMLILSLSMTVHIVVRYRQMLADNSQLSNNDIIFLTVNKMYKPCLFAALTTIFAFATLYTSGIKPVMDFGLMMCVGLLITYFTSFIFLPIVISFFNLKAPDSGFKLNVNNYFERIVVKYPNSILLIFTFLLLIGLLGSTKLEVENSFIDYFKKDTEIYKGMKLIDDKLGGTTPLDIIINFKDNTNSLDDDDFIDFGIDYDSSDYWFTKDKIDLIKTFHDHLESYEFSGKVLSLASVVRTAEKLNDNNEFDTLELSVLYKKLPSDLKEQIINPYVLIDKNQARITMRIIDTHPSLKRSEFINDLKTYINNNYSINDIEISLVGILILYNNMLESLFDSQIKSLLIVLFGIFIMLYILFRSLKIAFAAIVPNIIACFVILGTMGMMSIPLDLMTITIAAITIGIAVDNCIHYIYRYLEYFNETNDHLKTVIKCNETVGVAIKNTSFTIIAGFSILIFSNFFPTIYFGIFTSIAMFVALTGSLTLLPTLLQKIYYK